MSIWNQGRTPSHLNHQKPTEFDSRLRAAHDGEQMHDDASPRFEDWSPEKQRAAYEGTLRADVNRAAVGENALTFIALHPEFIDSEDNGDTINRTLKALFGDVVHTVEQFETAYQVACANNNLELNQAEIAKQAKAALKQRATAERSRIVNLPQEQLETMSLDEIRHLDAMERQRQLQAAGERGGNGF